MTGQLEKVLFVDLTERTTKSESRPELFSKYIGGASVASKLFLGECQPRIEPESPQSPMVFATGPLVGIFPNMTKAVAMFKSPLTGNLGESYAGGNFSVALRATDYGAVVIKGASDIPLSLVIERERPHMEDASTLRNRSPREVEQILKKSGGEALRSVIAIGRAGESGVNYASAIVDGYSHFGRLGLGAIMGDKKLKAICVRGTKDLEPGQYPELLELRNEIEQLISKTDAMRKYKELGTAANVLPLNAIGALPTKNFSRSTYDKADEISGESFARLVLEKKTTCPGCSVACIHLGAPRNNPPQNRENKMSGSPDKGLVPYHYQPIFALGANLEVSDPEAILQLISYCERFGMDAMTTGAVLGWATEAYEKGLIGTDETIGLRPTWGNVDTYSEMIENIANVRNEFYTILARGVDAAAEQYGGRDFAVTLGKISPAGYLTGYGHVVGTLVGARHSHLSNAGYRIDQMVFPKNVGPEGIVEALVVEEDWINVLNSLVACYFSRAIYSKEIVVKVLAAVGIHRTQSELMRLGGEISRSLYNYKLREGFDLTKERIPKRLLEVVGPAGGLKSEIIQRMISHYIKLRERADAQLIPA